MGNAVLSTTRDGKETTPLVVQDSTGKNSSRYYIENDLLYGIFAGRFLRLDLNTGKEEVLLEVENPKDSPYSFFVSSTDIYVTVMHPDNYESETKQCFSLWTSPKDDIHFRQVNLSDDPNDSFMGVFCYNDILYMIRLYDKTILTTTKDFSIIENLPKEVTAYSLRISGDMMYYADPWGDLWSVKSYNMQTGEITDIFKLEEDIKEFNLIDDRYIVGLAGSTSAYLYDLETGELIDMLSPDHLIQ